MARLSLLMLILASSLVACSNDSRSQCDNKYLLFWPDAAGNYAFREVKLHTLDSHKLSGKAARVYYQPPLTESGYGGEVAEAKFSYANGVCVPMDMPSALSINAYAQVEKLYDFDRELGTDMALNWPRTVGVQVDIGSGGHNNAAYVSVFDSMLITQQTLDEAIPVGLNMGVMGHEHFHAQFQHRVINTVNSIVSLINPLVELFYSFPSLNGFRVEDISVGTYNHQGRNNFIVRAWNEGFADLYGSIYTEQPDFVVASLPFVPDRKLSEPVRAFTSPSSVFNRSSDALASFSYSEGTTLARLALALANKDHSGSKRVFLARLMNNLNSFASPLAAEYRSKTFNVEDILPYALAGYEWNKESCALLRKAISSNLLTGRFAKCVGL